MEAHRNLLPARDVSAGAAERILPPGRMRPSEAAARFLKNDKGDYDPLVAPMMSEPLDQFAGRQYQGIVFVGPQRSSKTFGLVFGGLTYIVTCAPGDTLVVQMTQDAARSFSRQDLDRVLQCSPALGDRLSKRSRDDNTYDKWFRNGMVLGLAWPSASQLASRTLRYVIVTDYDRPENRDDVDGWGPLWDLAFKRVETYMSRGKCLAESSPGSDVVAGDWKPNEAAPHEAPPAPGILSVYNNGTRGRWYWPCWHCGDLFQAAPGYELFGLPSFERQTRLVLEEDLESLVQEYARLICPLCGGVIEQRMKPAMNAAGRWVHEGQRVTGAKVTGDPRRTNVWSGWLGGVAASYQRWDSMLRNWFQAVATYARTSDEAPLRLATTSDAGAAYIPRVIRNRRVAEDLVKRAEVWPKGIVPEGARFLTAAADVQAGRFVVQVHAWGVGLEQWLIDRYDISASNRPEGDRFAGLQPAAYVEDWLLLLPAALRRYRYADTELELPVLFMLVDSGGKAGVTPRAYAFWRRAKAMGHGDRVQLVRGDGRLGAPRIRKTFPDTSGRKDRRKAGSKGDVPVWQINTNLFKDGVAGDLNRAEPGAGYVHLPDWLSTSAPHVFDELVAEVRTEKGWQNPNGRANEATDLASYNRAAVVALGGERIDWDRPPAWAAPPEHQTDLRTRAARPRRRTRVVNSGVQV